MSLLNLKRKTDFSEAVLSFKEWKMIKRDERFLYLVPKNTQYSSLLRVPITEAPKVLTYRMINPVGDKIKKFRENKGMSQRKLSSISGVSQMTVSNVENGTCEKINSDTLDAILRALEIPLDEVYLTELNPVS